MPNSEALRTISIETEIMPVAEVPIDLAAYKLDKLVESYGINNLTDNQKETILDEEDLLSDNSDGDKLPLEWYLFSNLNPAQEAEFLKTLNEKINNAASTDDLALIRQGVGDIQSPDMNEILENIRQRDAEFKDNLKMTREEPEALTQNGEEVDGVLFESLHKMKEERPLSSGEHLAYSGLYDKYYPIHWRKQIKEDENRLLQEKDELEALAKSNPEITKTFGYENKLHNIENGLKMLEPDRKSLEEFETSRNESPNLIKDSIKKAQEKAELYAMSTDDVCPPLTGYGGRQGHVEQTNKQPIKKTVADQLVVAVDKIHEALTTKKPTSAKNFYKHLVKATFKENKEKSRKQLIMEKVNKAGESFSRAIKGSKKRVTIEDLSVEKQK
ncbi:MAG TPA: hypothetical protein VIK26_06505 [Clostridium sp.]